MRKLAFLVAMAGLIFAGSFRDLYPYLVDLPGWQAGKPEGSRVSLPMVKMVQAQREYTRGEATLKVTIVKGSGVALNKWWGPFAVNLEYEDESGWRKLKTIKGFPVGLQYNKEDKSGSVMVNLKSGESTVGLLVVEYSKISPEEALKIAEKFDWKGILKALQSL